MKKCIVAGILALLVAGCDDSNNPTSFVDDYNPPLTESSGTTYEGSYFPLKTGNTWEYTGTMDMAMEGTAEVSGFGHSESETLDTTMSTNATETCIVGEMTRISYSGSQISVYPVTSTVSMSDLDGEIDSAIEYLEELSDGIYQRATGYGESMVEMDDMLLIRKPLVVGDSWESNPDTDLGDLMELTDELGTGDQTADAQVTAEAVTYVIGVETIDVKGVSTPTIRLDQRADVSIKMSDAQLGDISTTIKGTVIMNLQEDVGVVRERFDMDMTMNMSMSDGGMSMTMNMTADMTGGMTLVSSTLGKERVVAAVELTPAQRLLVRTALKVINTAF